ncbi:MAG: DNA-binding transcriptional regulator [Verrucomicrobia bacterium]|nr:DNA-binding transcriptional regulator [Verrucomicrobiota bacterium]
MTTPKRKVFKVVLLIESSRSSGRRLLRGIADYARHHGHWAFYWEPAGLERAWPQLKALDADGIILRDVEGVAEVIQWGLPAIIVGHRQREIPGVANVITDSAAVGEMGAEHLLSKGFRHFAFCGFADVPWSELRGQSFQQRLARADRTACVHQSPTPESQQTWKTERSRMAAWLKSLPKPVGVMACNDDRGQHVIEACKIAGLRVPDEVAVLGADDDDLVCELSDPPLSSVSINFERAGYESAHLLDQLMRGKRVHAAEIIVQAPHVVARQSTDILAIADPQVARALRFIQDHTKVPISVADVAHTAGLSRRVLEMRFREHLDRSVLSEIRRTRVAQLCQMLVETNQSVAQIALAFGFSRAEHVARYLRKEMDMTPLEYRKKLGRW